MPSSVGRTAYRYTRNLAPRSPGQIQSPEDLAAIKALAMHSDKVRDPRKAQALRQALDDYNQALTKMTSLPNVDYWTDTDRWLAQVDATKPVNLRDFFQPYHRRDAADAAREALKAAGTYEAWEALRTLGLTP